MLAQTEELASPPQFQIFFGQQEAVTAVAHDLEPFQGYRVGGGSQQYAVGLGTASAYPAPELVHLGQPEPVRSLDDHQGSIGHIDPHFHHSRSDQHFRFIPGKAFHHRVFLFRLQTAMEEAAGNALEIGGSQYFIQFLRRLGIHPFTFFNQWTYHIGLVTFPDLMDHALVHRRPFVFCITKGLDRFSSRGQSLHQRYVQVPVYRKGQSPGNGRRSHDQHMGCKGTLLLELGPLGHPEPVLLIGDGQGQRMEHHCILDQGIGPHHRLDGTIGQPFQHLPSCFGRQAAGQKGRPDPCWFQDFLHFLVVLFGQDFRRCHQASLVAVFHRLCQGQERQGRFPGAYIPLDQSVHRLQALHVIIDFLPGFFLAVRQLEPQEFSDFLDQRTASDHLDAPAVPLDFHPMVEQAALEKEEFFEDQPLPGLFQKVRAFGKMDIFQSFQPGQEMFGLEDLLRQTFRQFLPGQGQSLAHRSPYLVLGQAAGQSIGRKDARSFCFFILHTGKAGTGDAFGRTAQVHLANDEYFIPRMIDSGHVGLGPEQDDLCKASAIPYGDSSIFHVPGAPPVVQPHDGPLEQLHLSPHGQFADGLYMGIV